MRKIIWKSLSNSERQAILKRPISAIAGNLYDQVREILNDIRAKGDLSVRAYTQKFDHYDPDPLFVPPVDIEQAKHKLSDKLRIAIDIAYQNIARFHAEQGYKAYQVETMPGLICKRLVSAIERVGLYIPGGSAPLFSTLLMLGIPSKIAGNKERVLCTPGDRKGVIHPAILYAASLCGIDKIARIGGAQAIGALAFGTDSIAPVAKIFGPGNIYVTAAKSLVSQDPGGPAIDMPAGPSEVLVIVTDETPPKLAAADLLSQAEHDPASQVVLISTDARQIDSILEEINAQLATLPRADIARQAMVHSLAIEVLTIDEALEVSNLYAPEHLILCFPNAENYQSSIKNAGSVFCGMMTPEALGDYASGTNHVLPTAGAARGYSGLSVEAFQKTISWQQASAAAIKNITPMVVEMARAEGLEAHARAMLVREGLNHE